MLIPLLLIGTAPDGPVGLVTFTPWDNPTTALDRYGERRRDWAYLQPTGTTFTVQQGLIWADDNRFYQVPFGASGGSADTYQEIFLPQQQISGNVITHVSAGITGAASGWLVYRTIPEDRDLCYALRCAASQAARTSPLGTQIGLLRVVAPDALYATGSMAEIPMYAAYPGTRSHDWEFVIATTGLTIYPPAAEILVAPLSFPFIPQTTVRGSKQTYTRYIGDLLTKLGTEMDSGRLPFVFSYTGSPLTPCSGLTTGRYRVRGGSSGSAVTADDYKRAIDRIDLSYFEIIGFPGVQGREIFDSADTLFREHVGYPFRMVAMTTGDTIETTKSDRWRSERLSIVGGKGIQGGYYRKESDLVSVYATLLSSGAGLFGLGTRQPLMITITATSGLTADERDVLADYGVVLPTDSVKGPVVHKGRSTDRDSSATISGVLRSVFRRMMPGLIALQGRPAFSVQVDAEQIVQTSLDAAIEEGAPLVEHVSQVITIDDTLQVSLDFIVSGSLDHFNAVFSLQTQT